MEEITCNLCSKEIKSDCDSFVTRCGHKFHDSCIQEFFRKNETECPKCSTILLISKKIEGILFKAHESKSINFYELAELFDKIEIYKKNMSKKIPIGIKKTVLEEAINLGFDLNSFNYINYHVQELLQYICENDLTIKLNILIDLGLKLDPSENFGNYVWMTAFKNESFGILENMRELNFDPKEIKLNSLKSLRLTKWLIDNGFDVNRYIGGKSFIHSACDSNIIDLVKLLISKGADINHKDENGQSPFHKLVKGATANSCSNENEKKFNFLQELINLGSNIESVDNDNSTPLYSALVNGNIDTIHFLLSNGADINAPRIKTLGPMLFYILECCEGNDIAMFKKLIEYKYFSDINEVDSNGQNCLHKVVLSKYNLDYVKFFVELGVNVNAQDSQGNTPLHILGSLGYANIYKIGFLIKRGANVYVENNNGEKAIKFLLR